MSGMFTAIAGIVVVTVVLEWPHIQHKWGPYRSYDQLCRFCGESQHVVIREGRVVERISTPSDVSRWVQALSPAHRSHSWVTCSSGGREEWFGEEYIACGVCPEAAGTSYAFRARETLGDEAGERYLAEFHKTLTLPHDQIVQYVKKMEQEIMADPSPELKTSAEGQP